MPVRKRGHTRRSRLPEVLACEGVDRLSTPEKETEMENKARAPNQRFSFDREKVKLLRSYYEQALKEGKTEFSFAGHLLLVDYAKYLLEYLESHFDIKHAG